MWEYEVEEKLFEELGNDIILQVSGSKEFEKLYLDEFNWIPTNAIDVCSNLLKKEKSKDNLELQFYLNVKLAKFYMRNSQLREAISALKDALSVKPTNLIANFRIAVLYESIGSGEDAILHYELAGRDNVVSKNLKDYLNNQIQRVKTTGPRQKGPYDGSGFQWLTG